MNELFTVVPPQDALEILLARCMPVGQAEVISLADALGRVTVDEIPASETLPAFARSTMDGYAVIAADTFGASESAPAYLRLCGEIAMGIAPALRVEPLGAARIHTGAMLPAGADAVVMVEDTNAHGDEVEILNAAAPGENIVGVGEDVVAGDAAIPAGCRLRAADLGGIAALGDTTVRVFAGRASPFFRPEVVAPAARPSPGQVRDVNATTIAAVISDAGGIPVCAGIVGDDLPRLEAAAASALAGADALVLSAGSSVSYRDLTARVDPLPPRTDAVIMVEDLAPHGDGRVAIREPVAPWTHVRPIGEDIVAMEAIVPKRRRLSPADLAAIASGLLRCADRRARRRARQVRTAAA